MAKRDSQPQLIPRIVNRAVHLDAYHRRLHYQRDYHLLSHNLYFKFFISIYFIYFSFGAVQCWYANSRCCSPTKWGVFFWYFGFLYSVWFRLPGALGQLRQPLHQESSRQQSKIKIGYHSCCEKRNYENQRKLIKIRYLYCNLYSVS